ncbi:MAG: 5-formyltetrahydrofolate cyclo-ligase [Proteobacteria bacterium]|nr:5-formyltetrahydrofolate cyclo-ligase [Pseudomonadota bacterium]MBU1386424.1 5-formyltetrahydrofolate cyclo-ligase [Pseudomonadota bacterium]MBU1544535.1 5-formyltetrahydrofolate cyclo-ligase [Pseudomonadota bacterium]MBU2429461.1 5-formyltetrahydrofolate cyclo-ligase [Pseudomonadota bacterium]MBU2480985.1 5-formyltetrahydrofolate cyclo-ligase [Pseudomonadota bacterium]
MDEIKNGKNSNLALVAERLAGLTEDELTEKYNKIEHKLFEFANFMEAHLAFLYTPISNEIPTEGIIKKALQIEKGLALPVFTDAKNAINLYKISNFNRDLVLSADDILEPDIEKCKKVSLDSIDIAVIPGLAFDDKGGRIGFGNNFYTRMITRLPETCRKISLAYEEQVVDQIQMESRKYTVDIIITDQRIIYKI